MEKAPGEEIPDFSGKLNENIKDQINVGLLADIAAKIRIGSDQTSPALIIANTDDPIVQFKAVYKLIELGCEQNVPSAGRALVMLRNLLTDRAEVGKILQENDLGRYENFARYLETIFVLPAEKMWDSKGKKLKEAYDKQREQSVIKQKIVVSDPTQVPIDFAEKTKIPPEGDFYENKELLTKGQIEKVVDRYKIQTIKIQETIRQVHQSIPEFVATFAGLRELIGEQEYKTFFGKLKKYFDFVIKSRS